MQNYILAKSRAGKLSEKSKNALIGKETLDFEEKSDLKKTDKKVLNILYKDNEKTSSARIQSALLNILEDYGSEKVKMENTLRAVLNILEDFKDEKHRSANTQTALLNILEDFTSEKTKMKNTLSAVLNILEDFRDEKNRSANTQTALLNILEDFNSEKTKMKNTLSAVLNILEDFKDEKLKLERTQRAVFNILDDYAEEKKKVEGSNENLTEANTELEQFAYVASHDLQEPLRTISNFVGLFEKKYSGKLDEAYNEYLNFIVTATSKMQNLIKDLLDFSRVGRNMNITTVDCNTILKDVLAEMGASIKESNAKIKSSLLPVLNSNEVELKRLFQNLLSNAIKFRKKNVPVEIDITVEKKDNEYIFAVKDNGIGIDQQFIHKLFVIFQRLHKVEEYSGTGIGLATCRKIVTILGGKIWVESTFGVGSTFYFTLPIEKSN